MSHKNNKTMESLDRYVAFLMHLREQIMSEYLNLLKFDLQFLGHHFTWDYWVVDYLGENIRNWRQNFIQLSWQADKEVRLLCQGAWENLFIWFDGLIK